MAEALTAQIEGLRAAVDGAKDEAKLWRRVRRNSLSIRASFISIVEAREHRPGM